MTSVAILPDENDYPLFESIIHYIDVNGPTKVSRLRDRLKADSKDIAAMCEFAEARGLLARVKPAGVFIWAFPATIAEAEEEIFAYLRCIPEGTYADSIVQGRNADERQFLRGVIYRLRDRGLITIDFSTGHGGFCRLRKVV